MKFKFFLAALILFGMVSLLPISAEESSGDGYRIASAKHVTVYAESGRFGGWPANHGLWSWGDEILVGFSAGYDKDLGERHHIDREKPEPQGYSIMPSSIRLREHELLTAVRCRDTAKSWIDCYRFVDDGASWSLDSTPVPDAGEGNPASLIRLRDGRLCLTYGHRAAPFRIYALMSSDQGKTWSKNIIVRDSGGGRDIGYPRSVQRSDDKIVTIYYFHDTPQSERYIAATIWDPNG